jgi:phosphoribosyl-ATP pyrophosphohydrolase
MAHQAYHAAMVTWTHHGIGISHVVNTLSSRHGEHETKKVKETNRNI